MVENKTSATILIVEDNVPNYILMARILNHHGYACEWKTSGFEIIEFAATLPAIDLVLMDIRLPYEDGFSAFEKIHNSENLQHLPVIAVTAYASTELMTKAKQAGFMGFISKPIDPERFADQIQKVLSGTQVWEIQ